MTVMIRFAPTGPWIAQVIFAEESRVSLCRATSGIVGVGCPVGIFFLHNLAGARINRACRHPLHRDAPLDRADIDAEIAGDAFVVLDLEYAIVGH